MENEIKNAKLADFSGENGDGINEEVGSVSASKKTAKKLTNIEFKYGALVTGSDIVYAMRLSAQVVDDKKGGLGAFGASMFGTGASDAESESDKINTVLLANIKPDGTVETVELTEKATLFKWVTADKEAKYEIPTYLNDTLRGIIGKDMADFKNILKDFNPIKDEYVHLLTAHPLVASAVNEFEANAISLRDTVVAAKKAGGNIGLDGFIERYAFKNHILLAGPRGVGKTFKVTEYSDAHHAHVVQLNGHSGIESIDILGYNIRASDGSFVWLDGPLTEAFRRAQTGQVILIIDELLRIKARELNIFISSLTPNSSGEFILNTSRVIDIVDGVGRCEVLKIPAENLWVVGTTNVGSDYDTDDMDLALADRFITFDVLMQEAVIHSILTSVNAKYENFDEIHITKLVNFFKSIEDLVKAQELPHGINTRHLTKVLSLAKDPKEFKSYLMDFVANVVSRQTDGNLNSAEVKIYKDALISAFGK